MPTLVPVFTIMNNFSPNRVAKKIKQSKRFAAAQERGDLGRVVVKFDAKNPNRGAMCLSFSNPEAIDRFLEENPNGFSVFKINGKDAIKIENEGSTWRLARNLG